MIEVFMPKLGPSIEQATVVRWYKSQGEPLRQGEALVDIETDKAVQELAAETDGILHKILIPEGELCAVGTVLALVGAVGEAVAERHPPAVEVRARAESPTAASPSTPLSSDDGKVIDRVLIKSSPSARRLAREMGVDLSAVDGTGPRGRIVADDVVRASAETPAVDAAVPSIALREPAAPRQAPAVTPIDGCAVKERRALSSMRRVIAERMVRSKHVAPHFYISMDIDMTRVKEAREAWKGAGETSVPSYNDFILWAAARTLRSFPDLNASLAGDEVVIYSDINIGMATGIPDGLIVPVIKRADRMSVRGVACHSRDLALKARDKKLTPAECEDGTFTVSNLGMLGVDTFIAIINPPQCAILAVGQVTPRVVTDGNSIAIRTLMTATLSIDHRVADGILASRFLGALKESLEAFQEADAG